MKKLIIKQSSGLKISGSANGRQFGGMTNMGNILYPMDDRIQHENR